MRKFKPTFVRALVVFLVVGGSFLGAAVSQTVVNTAKDRYEKLQIFTKVLNLVQQYYVEDRKSVV